MCTRMLVGVAIARKLGLVSYSFTHLFAYLVKTVRQAKESIDTYGGSKVGILAEFLAESGSHRLVVKSNRRDSSCKDQPALGSINDMHYVLQSPPHGREITYRVEFAQKTMFISRKALRAWCKANNKSFASLIKYIKEHFLVRQEETGVDLVRYHSSRARKATVHCVRGTGLNAYRRRAITNGDLP